MRFPDRSSVARAVTAWWLPAVIACAVAALYISFSLAQWRTLSDPSWDLAIFAEAAQAYSRFEAPIVPGGGDERAPLRHRVADVERTDGARNDGGQPPGRHQATDG